MKFAGKCRSLIILTVLAVSLGMALLGCGGSKSGGGNNGGSDTSTGVGLVLDRASLLNDDFTNGAGNWEFLNGAAGAVTNGVLTVSASSTQGIAMRLKDSVWQSLGSPDGYYVEMYIRPATVPSGSYKNFGIASNISGDGRQWYWAGLTAARLQAGYYDGTVTGFDMNNLKKYQNSGDGSSLSTASDLVYYKMRYEYNNGTINFYCNDLSMGKNYPALADFKPNQGFSGTIGVYTCYADFEVTGVRIGRIDENQTKLILQTSDTSLPLLWSKYMRWINNTSSTGIRMGAQVAFTVTATGSTGSAGTWTATSSNPKVLSVSAASGSSGDTLTLAGAGVGTATVIVANGSAKRAITYKVEAALTYVPDNYGTITTKVYPAVGATSAYTDGELAVTFDNTPQIASSLGSEVILISNYDTGAVVDTIHLDNDKAVISGRSASAINVKSQRVRIDGNTLYITPHVGALEYGKHYYLAVANGVFAGTLNGKNFTGFSPESKSWNFTTKSAPALSGRVVTVDGSQNSTANFRTVQAALNYVSGNNIDDAEIRIQPGTYYELLTFIKSLNLTLRGMGSGKYGNDVVIRYTNGNSINSSDMSDRCLAYITSTGTVNLVNLTLYNTGIKSEVGQAEALFFRNNGKLIANNCSFISQQDTICSSGYNWFYNCHVEGNTDFIWGGAAVALFEDCEIYCISPGSYIFQARQTDPSYRGHVLLNCAIKTNSGETSYFARNGGYYDNVSIVKCSVSGGGTINSWSGTPKPNPGTATTGWKQYGLTDGSGNPITVSGSTSHTLTDAEYNTYWSSRALILGSWNPELP